MQAITTSHSTPDQEDKVARTGLCSLPNEILVSVLDPFSTRDLLPLTRVSSRFNALILRILHRRLLASASVDEHKLILECYHPLCKATEPYMVCSYRGTERLDTTRDEAGVGRLGHLGALYSRFRPQRKDDERRSRIQRRYGSPVAVLNVASGRLPSPIVFQETSNTTTAGNEREGEEGVPASLTVMLDDGEFFSQLCVSANLLGRGAFTTCAGLTDGFVRLRREWLDQQARSDAGDVADARTETDAGQGSSAGGTNRPLTDDPRIVWVDSKKDIGLKVRVRERRREMDMPVLAQWDEGPAAMYEIEFEALLIRNTCLLMSVEKAVEEEQNAPHNAIIFGSISVGY